MISNADHRVTDERHALDTLNVGDLAALRKIIASVIDEGDDGNYWRLYLGQFTNKTTKAELDNERNRFIETIITRIIETAAPSVGGGQ